MHGLGVGEWPVTSVLHVGETTQKREMIVVRRGRGKGWTTGDSRVDREFPPSTVAKVPAGVFFVVLFCFFTSRCLSSRGESDFPGWVDGGQRQSPFSL